MLIVYKSFIFQRGDYENNNNGKSQNKLSTNFPLFN